MSGFDDAIAEIDRVNAEDPNYFEGEPLARHQGQRADHWVTALDPSASLALRLAARAHHLRRWAVPRDTFPEGRAGYLSWRRDQKARHAEELMQLLSGFDVDREVVERAAVIVTKRGLGTDPEVQVFEDAVALIFIETQLRSAADKLDDDDRMVGVVVKTLRKMSAAGHAAVAAIPVDDRSAAILARAEAAFTS